MPYRNVCPLLPLLTCLMCRWEFSPNMAGWILRTFITRDVSTMMLLYKSFVRSHFEYCCPLWSPHLQRDIIQIEAVQRSFTAKIQGLRDLSY